MRSKYNNRKVEIDGITFDSTREAQRYRELLLLEKAGEVAELQVHVPFEITVKGELICKYIADFVYYDTKTCKQVVEDVKGVRTAAYRLKKKLMKAVYWIDILETK